MSFIEQMAMNMAKALVVGYVLAAAAVVQWAYETWVDAQGR